MRFNFSSGRGWFRDSYRHSLASKGIRTSFQQKTQELSSSELNKQILRNQEEADLKKRQREAEARRDRLELEAQRAAERQLSPVTEKRYREAEEEMARAPFEKFLGRLKTGSFDKTELSKNLSEEELKSSLSNRSAAEKWAKENGIDLAKAEIRVMVDGTYSVVRKGGASDIRKRLIADAAFDGAKSLADKGVLPDWSIMKQAGLNDFQIRQIAQAYVEKVGTEKALTSGDRIVASILSERGVKETAAAVGAVGGEVVGATVTAAEKGIQAELALGAQKFEQAPEDAMPGVPEHLSSFDMINKNQARVRIDAYGDEVVETPGIFNPLAVGGLDQYIKQKDKANKARADRMLASEKVDYFVNDVFRGKQDLAKVDLAPYQDGLRAFKRGDREGLMKSISDLEGENFSLKHKISLVDNIRQQILSNNNVTQTMLRGRDSQSNAFFNPLVGFGSGSAAYADQTDKMSRTMTELQKASNDVSQRIAVLKRKLNKINSLGQIDDSAPERPVQVLRNENVFAGTTIDDGAGLMRHNNVSFGKTNVLFNNLDELNKTDEMEEM